jgi:hypothetical protein
LSKEVHSSDSTPPLTPPKATTEEVMETDRPARTDARDPGPSPGDESGGQGQPSPNLEAAGTSQSRAGSPDKPSPVPRPRIPIPRVYRGLRKDSGPEIGTSRTDTTEGWKESSEESELDGRAKDRGTKSLTKTGQGQKFGRGQRKKRKSLFASEAEDGTDGEDTQDDRTYVPGQVLVNSLKKVKVTRKRRKIPARAGAGTTRRVPSTRKPKGKTNPKSVFKRKSNRRCQKCPAVLTTHRSWEHHQLLHKSKDPKAIKCGSCSFATRSPVNILQHRKLHKPGEFDLF